MSLSSDLTKADIVYNRMLEGSSVKVLNAYKDSLQIIQTQVADFYRKYAGKEGTMTMSEVTRYNRLRTLEQGISAEIKKLSRSEEVV